jgi:hypothetical protein
VQPHSGIQPAKEVVVHAGVGPVAENNEDQVFYRVSPGGYARET